MAYQVFLCIFQPHPPLCPSLSRNYLALSCLIPSLCNPSVWPCTSPPSSSSLPPFCMTLDGHLPYLFPPLPLSSSHFRKSPPIPPCLCVSPLWSVWHFNSHVCHTTQRGAMPSVHNPWNRGPINVRVQLSYKWREGVLITVQSFIRKNSFVRVCACVCFIMQEQEKKRWYVEKREWKSI